MILVCSFVCHQAVTFSISDETKDRRRQRNPLSDFSFLSFPVSASNLAL